jgi:hypothetical protein
MNTRIKHVSPRLILSVAFLYWAVALPLTARGQQSVPTTKINEFAGTWHWMYNGRPFATMVLTPKADGLTGSLTNASIDTNPDGKITSATALSGSSPIIKSWLVGEILHIVGKDDDDEVEWAVKLTSATTADIVLGGDKGPKIEPIHAERQ